MHLVVRAAHIKVGVGTMEVDLVIIDLVLDMVTIQDIKYTFGKTKLLAIMVIITIIILQNLCRQMFLVYQLLPLVPLMDNLITISLFKEAIEVLLYLNNSLFWIFVFLGQPQIQHGHVYQMVHL